MTLRAKSFPPVRSASISSSKTRRGSGARCTRPTSGAFNHRSCLPVCRRFRSKRSTCQRNSGSNREGQRCLPGAHREGTVDDVADTGIASNREQRSSANRTDSQGRFSVQAKLSSVWGSRSIRFASTDFSQQAIAVVHGNDPDGPIGITLRPLRQVRAHVVVKSKVEPLENIDCRVFTSIERRG